MSLKKYALVGVLVVVVFSAVSPVFAYHRRNPPPPPLPTNAVLVTNEYAYWNPSSSSAVKSPIWEMDSGSLFLRDGRYWTGKPDNISPNALSTNGNNSAVFRANTKAGYKNFAVSFNLTPVAFVTTPSTPSVAWDGVHIFLRYQSQYNLYYASVMRRDGMIVIKKKCAGGSSNGGTYYNLTQEIKKVTALNTTIPVKATIIDQADGSVKIELYVNNTLSLTAVDKGLGCSVIKNTGKTGVRGDNLEFYFDNFRVESM